MYGGLPVCGVDVILTEKAILYKHILRFAEIEI